MGLEDIDGSVKRVGLVDIDVLEKMDGPSGYIDGLEKMDESCGYIMVHRQGMGLVDIDGVERIDGLCGYRWFRENGWALWIYIYIYGLKEITVKTNPPS